MKKHKPILVIGPPRSGTSITSRIIQGHFGKHFPFRSNRHAEPEEAVKITRDFLERQGLSFEDRFYFPDIKGDATLLIEMKSFLNKYKDCVIKEPVWTIFFNYYPHLLKEFPIVVFVGRKQDDVRDSLIHHKLFTREHAEKSVMWYYLKYWNLRRSLSRNIRFSDDKEDYKMQIKRIVENIGFIWNEEIFNEHYNEEQIKPYKNK